MCADAEVLGPTEHISDSHCTVLDSDSTPDHRENSTAEPYDERLDHVPLTELPYMDVCSHFLLQTAMSRMPIQSECLSDTQTSSLITWTCSYRGVRVGEAANPGPPQPMPPPRGGPRHRIGKKQSFRPAEVGLPVGLPFDTTVVRDM
eukprot:2641660-Amphidinium_carterae.1